ncbi:MAG TPA: BON domain-containing protein [Steroidobacteraceae bacterium]|jgi:osmotically-inducible protein OsmY
MKLTVIALCAVLGAMQAGTALAQAPDNSRSNSATENSTDHGSVADGQSNRPQDLQLTRSIRRSVMADKTLSVDAHNVKIVTANGHVTVNGIVRSDAEKSAIIAKAVSMAGADKVLDALKVAPRS